MGDTGSPSAAVKQGPDDIRLAERDAGVIAGHLPVKEEFEPETFKYSRHAFH